MATKSQTILDRVLAVLTGTLPGTPPVYDDRVDAFDRDEGVANILITPESEETEPFDNVNELSTLYINIEIDIRANAWKAAADVIAAAMHPLLMNDAALNAMVIRIRRNAKKWEAHEADITAGVLTLQYRVLYLLPPSQI